MVGGKTLKVCLLGFIIVILLSSILSQANILKSQNIPEKFYLWAISDTHSATNWDDDVSFSNNKWSGGLIDEGVERIDYAFIAGDLLLMGGYNIAFSNYLNLTCSCIMPDRDMTNFWNQPADKRPWGFCMGNHEEYLGGCTAAAEGLGLDPSKNWYNNDVVMGHSYNYTALRGNLLFIYMGGSRDSPGEYTYNLPSEQDFYWLKEKVEWADNNNINVIIVAHSAIFNSSNSYGYPSGYTKHDVYYDTESNIWVKCDEHDHRTCDFDDPWPGEDYWSECDDFWDLINEYKNVNLWFNGHSHTCADSRNPPPHKHAGWDTTLGVERDIQKSKYCTFVNCGAAFAWGLPWSNSRMLTFTENSKDVLFKNYDHINHCYGHEQGWDSSSQDITITNCLKYPFNPDFEPLNNAPNTPEKPTGRTSGKTNNEYSYTSKTTDPEGDKIYYLFSWGQNKNSGWIGPLESGTSCTASNSWDEDGAYIVKVKAKDIYGWESGWSDPLNVVMPKKESKLFSFLSQIKYIIGKFIYN